MSITTITWIVILIAALIIEILTMGLTTIWFAGGALIATVISALGGPIGLQIVAFLVISVLLLIFTRPIAMEYFNKDRVRTNAESLVGRQAIVISDIDNIKAVGQVSVSGQEWSARSYSDTEQIQQGAVVTIVAISGVKLICKPLPAETAAAEQ